MTNEKEQKSRVAASLDELAHAVNQASLCFDVWWVCAGEGREQYLRAINKFPTFFSTSIHAHFVAFLVALYRLFETRRDTLNVGRVVTLLKEDQAITDHQLSKLEALLTQARPLWRKITIVRSDVFAHQKENATIEQSFKKAKLTPNEVRHLIDLSKAIVN